MTSIRILLLSIASSAILSSGVCASPNTVPLLEDRIAFIFEPESLELADGWEVRRDIEGSTGEGYIQWSKPDTSDPYQGVILCRFTIQKAGVYQLLVRCHQGGAEWDAANDMFVYLQTAQPVEGYVDISKQPEKLYVGSDRDHQLTREQRREIRSSLTDQWRWSTWGETKRTVVRMTLDPGTHELAISGRSHGFIIDRIVLLDVSDVDFEQQPDKAWLGRISK